MVAPDSPIKTDKPIGKPKVFISYSHEDEQWLRDLQKHWAPYVRQNGTLSAWSDKQIVPGSKWFEEINSALASAKVAVLLVTSAFLASEFIHEHELMPLLKQAQTGGVKILWIPIRMCAYKKTPLASYQAACDPNKPLANMKDERDHAWVKICDEIEKAISCDCSSEATRFLNRETISQKGLYSKAEVSTSVKRTETSEMKYDEPYYWRIVDGKKDGPYCQQCWDNNNKLIRLQDRHNGCWMCMTCKNSYTDRTYDDRPDTYDSDPLDIRRL